MKFKELAFLNIVNAKAIERLKWEINKLNQLDYICDYDIMNFMLRDIIVIIRKAYDFFNDDEIEKVKIFLDELSRENNIEAEIPYEEQWYCTDESILMSISLFYQNEKVFMSDGIGKMSITHTAFCILKGIVLGILWDNNFKEITEGILYLCKYFDSYENELLSNFSVTKAENINVDFPSYMDFLNMCKDSKIDNRLFSMIKKSTYKINIDVDDEKIYTGWESCKSFSILDSILGNKAVIVCSRLLEECYTQEYDNYKEIIGENPYDENIEFIFENDNNKKNIEREDRLFNKFAFVNNEGKLVTDYIYDSVVNKGEYVIVERNSKYGWIRKKDMKYVEPQYDEIEYDGRMWLKVRNFNENYKIVDYENGIVRKDFSKYDDIKLVSDYMLVKKEEKWGVIRIDDKVCLPVVYDSLELLGKLFIAKIFSKNIKLIYNADFSIIMSFELNVKIELCYENNIYKYIVDDCCGYFDEQGKILFPAIYEFCKLNKKSVSFGNDVNKKIMFYSNYFIMDVGNKKHFEINENAVVICDNYKIRIINEVTLEETVFESEFEIQYKDIWGYTNDDSCKVETYGIILKCNNKYGVIDLNGNLILPFEYDFIYDELFKENNSREYLGHISKTFNEVELFGLAKRDGEILFECEYENEIKQDENGNWILRKNGCQFIVDSKGNVLNCIPKEITWM